MDERMKAKIVSYIQQHCETVRVEDVAKTFGYSYFHFSRLFKKVFHVSAVEYIATVKVQKSIETISPHRTLLSSQLSSGYLSSGTFTNTFKKKTGLNPNDYKKNLNHYHSFFNAVVDRNSEEINALPTPIVSKNALKVDLILPENFKGIAFVGLFRHRIPNHIPVVGKPFRQSQHFTFENVPDGSYYLMSCGIPVSKTPLNYFFLKDEYRCYEENPITFPGNNFDSIHTLRLREKVDEDPPLTINLPHLLYSYFKTAKMNKL